MKFSFFKFLPLIMCGLSLCLHAQNDVSDESTGVAFPSEVSFDHAGKEFHLQLTGVATRRKLIIKVYSVAHYLQADAAKNKSDILQAIMQDDNAKQLTIKWVRSATVDQVQNGYQESFQKAVSASEYDQLKNDINKFTSLFTQAAQKGDEYILRWLPGGYVEVLINGKEAGSITNKEFAKGLWSIWFGSDSVVNRDRLISLSK